MIEELKAILDLLGDVSGIALYVFISWLIFKLVIMLSTTGSVVYLTKLGFDKLVLVIANRYDSLIKLDEVKKQKIITDVDIQGLCITSDGTYHHVVESLKLVKQHVNTIGGSYLHSEGAVWLRQAIEEKIKNESKN